MTPYAAIAASLRACTDPQKRHAADVIEELLRLAGEWRDQHAKELSVERTYAVSLQSALGSLQEMLAKQVVGIPEKDRPLCCACGKFDPDHDADCPVSRGLAIIDAAFAANPVNEIGTGSLGPNEAAPATYAEHLQGCQHDRAWLALNAALKMGVPTLMELVNEAIARLNPVHAVGTIQRSGGLCSCVYRCGDAPGWEKCICCQPKGMLRPLPTNPVHSQGTIHPPTIQQAGCEADPSPVTRCRVCGRTLEQPCEPCDGTKEPTT